MYKGNLMDFLSRIQCYLKKEYPHIKFLYEKRFERGIPQNDKYFIVFDRDTWCCKHYLVVSIDDDEVEEKIFEYINKALKINKLNGYI